MCCLGLNTFKLYFIKAPLKKKKLVFQKEDQKTELFGDFQPRVWVYLWLQAPTVMQTHNLGIPPSTESCHMFPQAGAGMRHIRIHRHPEHPKKYNASLVLKNHRLRINQQPKSSSGTRDNLPGNITAVKRNVKIQTKYWSPLHYLSTRLILGMV